jgi:LPXTG-site transpeptidase (sortase) family protein
MLAVIAAAWVVILVAGGGSSSAGDAAVMGQPGAVLKLPPPSPDAAGIPVRLAIPAIGVDTEIRPYTVPDAKAGSDARTGESCYQDGAIVCVDPPEADVAYWQVGGRAGVAYGDMPGGETRGTVYIHGHAGNPAQRPVFNDLPDLKAGDTADVATAYGVFTYTVEDVRNIPKDDLPYDEEVLNQVPGRLMLITCYHGPGAETVNGSAADNTVVTLQLTGNRALDATDNPGGGA